MVTGRVTEREGTVVLSLATGKLWLFFAGVGTERSHRLEDIFQGYPLKRDNSPIQEPGRCPWHKAPREIHHGTRPPFDLGKPPQKILPWSM